jgi:hypothetical protein
MKLGQFISLLLILISVVFATIDYLIYTHLNLFVDTLIVIVPFSFFLGITLLIFSGSGDFLQQDNSKPVLNNVWKEARRIEKIAWVCGGTAGLVTGLLIWLFIDSNFK